MVHLTAHSPHPEMKDSNKIFDRWYLDIALQRRDFEVVAERLLACVKNPAFSEDRLVSLYEGDFRRLLAEISDWRMDQPQFSQDFAETVQELAENITFDEEFKLRLAWAIAVKQYNMNLIDGKPARPPVAEASAGSVPLMGMIVFFIVSI